MKMSKAAFILMWAVLAGCRTEGESARESPRQTPRKSPAKGTPLTPDLAKSFATLAGDTEFIVCIMGDDWALRAYVPRESKKMPAGKYRPSRCTFYRGPDLRKYVHPPAGPVAPPIPREDPYSVREVTDLTVTVLPSQQKREPEGHLRVVFSAFKAGEEAFQPTGPVRLTLRGPYP